MNRTYERWSELSLSFPLFSSDEGKSCSAWPTYYIEQDCSGNVTDLLGKEIAFMPKHPNDIDWQDQLTQLKSLQKNITKHQRQRVGYWKSGSVGKVWYMVLDQLATQYDIGMESTTRLHAILHAAINDALIAARNYKYFYDCARPIQLSDDIQLYAPFSNSPGFPSELSCISGTASTVIGHFFPKEQESLTYLAQDCAESRCLSGSHFFIDTEEGLNLGFLIAEAVTSQLAREKDRRNMPIDTIYTAEESKLSIDGLSSPSSLPVVTPSRRHNRKPLKPISVPSQKKSISSPKPVLFV